MLDRLTALIQKRWIAALLGSLVFASPSLGQMQGYGSYADPRTAAPVPQAWRSASGPQARPNPSWQGQAATPPVVHHAPISESTVFPTGGTSPAAEVQSANYADDQGALPELPEDTVPIPTTQQFQSYAEEMTPSDVTPPVEGGDPAYPMDGAGYPLEGESYPLDGDSYPSDGDSYVAEGGDWTDGATLLARKAPVAPNMLGDFLGKFYVGPAPAPDENIIRTPEDNAYYKTLIRFKAADNRSPRPQTRLFTSYNYFSGVYDSSLNLGRTTFGGELAMFNKLFSVELYADYNNFSNGTVANSGVWGDLQSILKGVLFQRNNLLISWGTGIGYPTADRPPGTPGASVQVSPFIGYIFTSSNGRWFVQGFEQIDVMIRENRQLIHTDIGAGCWLLPYDEDRRITGIAPTIELHIYTPIDPSTDRPPELRGLEFYDVVNMTFGCTTFVTPSLSFAAGVGVPLSGRDYNVEGMAHFNWFYGGIR